MLEGVSGPEYEARDKEEEDDTIEDSLGPQGQVYCVKNSIRIRKNHTLFHNRDIIL